MTTYTRRVLTPETMPKVDIDFMNNTHFEEVELVMVVGNQILAYQENELVTDMDIYAMTESLEYWLSHTHAHFERENELMREIQFPPYQFHAGEHEIALSKMTEIVNDWKQEQDIERLADYVFIDWPSWFEAHANSMDMITARYALMQGYDPHTKPVLP